MAKAVLRQPYARFHGTVQTAETVRGLDCRSQDQTTIVRNNPRQPKTITAHQQLIRQIMAAAAAGWKALTKPQTDAWRAFARGRTVTNLFGQAVNVTGRSAYTTINTYRQIFGQTLFATPPTYLTSTRTTCISTCMDAGTALVLLGSRSGTELTHIYVRVSKPLPSAGYQSKPNRLRTITNAFADSTQEATTPDAWGFPLMYEQFSLAPGDRIAIGVQSLSPEWWPTDWFFEPNHLVG